MANDNDDVTEDIREFAGLDPCPLTYYYHFIVPTGTYDISMAYLPQQQPLPYSYEYQPPLQSQLQRPSSATGKRTLAWILAQQEVDD